MVCKTSINHQSYKIRREQPHDIRFQQLVNLQYTSAQQLIAINYQNITARNVTGSEPNKLQPYIART